MHTARILRTLRETVQKTWKIVLVVAVVYVALSLAFWWAETTQPCIESLSNAPACHQLSLGDALWWGIVTLSTVGYGDIVPHTLLGRAVAGGLMVFQIGFLGYLLTIIISAVTETRLKLLTGSMGSDMKGHIVVGGWNNVGKSAVRELLAAEQKVAVIAGSQEDIATIRTLGSEDEIFACMGEITSEETLRRAGVGDAFAVIFCVNDDTENLIAALNVRTLYPTVRVVASVKRTELRRTLRAAGVTYVASPDDMGGRLCSSAAFRPEIALAVEDLTTATYGADIQEFAIRPGSTVAGLPLPQAEAKVREASDCLIIGVARPTGQAGEDYSTIINPPASTKLEAGQYLLVLGSLENLDRFAKWYGVPQGR